MISALRGSKYHNPKEINMKYVIAMFVFAAAASAHAAAVFSGGNSGSGGFEIDRKTYTTLTAASEAAYAHAQRVASDFGSQVRFAKICDTQRGYDVTFMESLSGLGGRSALSIERDGGGWRVRRIGVSSVDSRDCRIVETVRSAK